MCTSTHKPTPEVAMSTGPSDNTQASGISSVEGDGSREPVARLQAIHDLIRSGRYYVPASAIADRMIERMLADRRSAR